MTPVLGGSLILHTDDGYKPLLIPVDSVDGFSSFDTSGKPKKKSVDVLKSAVIGQLTQFCGRVCPSIHEVKCWPASVARRWMNLNRRKSSYELGILSWNTNGRLDFRGCRESLLRRW